MWAETVAVIRSRSASAFERITLRIGFGTRWDSQKVISAAKALAPNAVSVAYVV